MLPRDVRYALRMLGKDPSFTCIAVVSLALGIGMNAAVFSFADALLLRPLPVPRPGEVLSLGGTAPEFPFGSYIPISYPDYRDFRAQSKSFDGLAAFAFTEVGMTESPDALPQLRLAMAVSGNFFRVMQVEPALGRAFTPEEDRVAGRDAVVVLGYDTWRRHFNADPNIVGRRLRLNNVEFTVIGVAPEEFTGMDTFVRPNLFIPVMMLPRVEGVAGPGLLEQRGERRFTVKGRLQPGVRMRPAQAELATIAAGLEKAYPDTNRKRGIRVRTELQMRADQSPPNAALANMLLAVAALVLIIACANVANLLLSRARRRAREMAVRLAVGAGRARLVRQLLTESLIVALAGGALGLLLADTGVEYFSTIRFPTDLPIAIDVRLDQRVLLFSLFAAVLSTLMFGLVPAIHSARTNLVATLKAGENNPARRRTLGRNALVTAQVALSLMLLVAATMFFRNFRETLLSGPGFRIDHLLMMSFNPSLVRYTPEKAQEFYKELVSRARQLTGVKHAALCAAVPFGNGLAVENIVPEGYQFPPGHDHASIIYGTVDDQYFQTIGIPLVRGRAFTTGDTAQSPRVAVINQVLANRYWPNQDAVGRRFRLGDRGGPWLQVVGVAKTSKYIFFAENPTPVFYLPLSQNPRPAMTLLAESSGEPGELAKPLRDVVRSLDPHQPVFDVNTMQAYNEERSVRIYRMIVVIVGAMGLLGFSLALVGLYSLVAYSVSRRTREIGIRIAMGAKRRDILRMVLRQGVLLALSGVALGLAGSYGLLAGIAALFDLKGGRVLEPWGFIVVPSALFAITMIACYFPARHAAAIDPNQALHHD